MNSNSIIECAKQNYCGSSALLNVCDSQQKFCKEFVWLSKFAIKFIHLCFHCYVIIPPTFLFFFAIKFFLFLFV
jgi:hypothetical protein